MAIFRGFLKRIRTLFSRADRELDDELRFHVEQAVARNRARGMGEDEARRQALIMFGGFDVATERCREERSARWVADLFRDVHYALRQLRRKPAFTVVVVLTLALGVGLNTAIFSFINEMFLKPLPVGDPGNLVNIFHADLRTQSFSSLAYPDLRDARELSIFDGVAGYSGLIVHLGGAGQAERLSAEIVTANYFDVLRVSAPIGRTFVTGEDLRPVPVAVISYGYWQRRFQGDVHVTGQSITVNGFPFTVVGVAPRGFSGLALGQAPELWIPLGMHVRAMPSPMKGWDFATARMTSRTTHWLDAVARLRPGVPAQQAEAALRLRALQAAASEPSRPEWPNYTIVLRPANASRVWPGSEAQLARFLGMLLGVAGLVLLIACANVANLLLARGVARERETAVRLALGASRGRLLRQALAEGAVLATLGMAAALGFAITISGVLAGIRIGDYVPELPETSFDARVLAFCAAAMLTVTFATTLLQALHVSGRSVLGILKQANTAGPRLLLSPIRMREALIAAQVALSLMLLISAGLLIRSLLNERAIDPGFRRSGLLLASFDLGLQDYDDSRIPRFHSELLNRVSSVPGIRSATLAAAVPLSGRRWANNVKAEGDAHPGPNGERNSNVNYVGPRYFETAGIELRAGRDFTDRDSGSAPNVAIINETFARDAWPSDAAIGKHLYIKGSPAPVEVVGVVSDSRYRNLRETPRPCFYRPILQAPVRSPVTLYARSDGDPLALAPLVRNEVRALDPALPLFDVETMEQHVASATGESRAAAAFVASFGGLALVMVAVGLYGLISFAVARRSQEIGIRLALGCTRASICGLVIGHGLRLVAIGLAFGLALSFAATRLLRSLLYGVSPGDAGTYLGVGFLMLIVAAAACFAPARRAARTDPMCALRCE